MNATELTSEQIADALGMRVNGSRWHKVVDPSELSFDIAAVSDFCAVGCSRDHRTPEERAVIEAALTWYTDETIFKRETTPPLTDALENLLTAKAKTEEIDAKTSHM